jgi:hypothetical protein
MLKFNFRDYLSYVFLKYIFSTNNVAKLVQSRFLYCKSFLGWTLQFSNEIDTSPRRFASTERVSLLRHHILRSLSPRQRHGWKRSHITRNIQQQKTKKHVYISRATCKVTSLISSNSLQCSFFNINQHL